MFYLDQQFRTVVTTKKGILSFLDYHFQALVKQVESYIKDTNHFLKKT